MAAALFFIALVISSLGALGEADVRVLGVQVSIEPGANLLFLSAKVVLSVAGAEVTYGSLLPPLGLEEQRPRPLDGARSMVVAYLGLKESPAGLGFRGENRWIFRDWKRARGAGGSRGSEVHDLRHRLLQEEGDPGLREVLRLELRLRPQLEAGHPSDSLQARMAISGTQGCSGSFTRSRQYFRIQS